MIYPRIFCRGENRLDTPGTASNDGKYAACELDALRLCDEKAFAHALLLALSAVDLTESVTFTSFYRSLDRFCSRFKRVLPIQKFVLQSRYDTFLYTQ